MECTQIKIYFDQLKSNFVKPHFLFLVIVFAIILTLPMTCTVGYHVEEVGEELRDLGFRKGVCSNV